MQKIHTTEARGARLRALSVTTAALALAACVTFPGEAPAPAPPPPEPVATAAPAPTPVAPAPEPPPDPWHRFVAALEPVARAEVPVALVRGSNDTVLIRISGPSLWDAKGAPSAAFKKFLARLATAIKTVDGASIAIDGHTDASGPRERQLATSRSRAQAVLKQLATAGVAAQRLHASGQGARVPVATNATATGRAANTRIDIVVTRAAARTDAPPTFSPQDPPARALR